MLDGDPALLKGHSSQFSAHVRCGQTAGWMKMPLGTEVGLGPGDIVLDGDLAPRPPKRGKDRQILAHVYCDQMARRIKMPVGRALGLSPGDIVLDGDPAPPNKRYGTPPSPLFSPCLFWPNGWVDQDATWYSGNLSPVHIVLDGDPAPPPPKGHSSPPLFGPCLLWPNGRPSQLLLSTFYICILLRCHWCINCM